MFDTARNAAVARGGGVPEGPEIRLAADRIARVLEEHGQVSLRNVFKEHRAGGAA